MLVCAERIVHAGAVREARANLPPSSVAAGATVLFAAPDDPTRLRFVAARAARELCVCDLVATLGMSQPAVSHHVRVLRQPGVVPPRRDGRCVYDALGDEHVSDLSTQALDHVRHRQEQTG